ncbi:pentatricopeptide repeat-containing protein At2g33680 [Silene latifolia]|uniref:pentatricopeptide repeat-containing protein At2g33680 n=1 Tax=Silene latifolia TaxID=37657 RepID=UPI003D781D3C
MSSAHRLLFKELVQLTKEQDLRKGKALHAKIIRTDSFSNVYLANCIVNLYAKCGQLAKARLAFDNIQNKDEVSWSSIINAYAQRGGPNSYVFVMDLFKQMRVENYIPSSHSFAGVFRTVSNLDGGWVGKQVHSLAIKTDHCEDVVVGSSILNMYCRSGLISDARRMFDRMPERNSVSWATMLSGYASCGMAEETVGLFKLIVGSDEEKAYQFFLTSVLSAFARPELLDAGRGIHCFAVKSGVVLIPEVRNALLTMYMKCGGMENALQVFSMSTDKNPIMWSAVVTGLAQVGNSKRALELFSNMHFSGISPSEFTFVGVINACSDICAIREGKQVHSYAVKMGFGMQLYIMSSLVDMYAKSGCVADARKGFDCLREPDVVLWTSMIAGYIQNGDNEEALSLYARMEEAGISPNDLTLASVLKGCSSLAALEQGKQIHAHAIKYGLTKEVTVGSSLTSMYAKCGCIDEGRMVFQRMTTKDVVSWNVMISGLAQNGCSEKALELFEEMRLLGVKPDNVTFVNILSACSHMGLVEKGWDYFRMISREFGLEPGLEHYACMVDAYSRAGRLTEAKQFIESATIDHGMCLWRILLGACRNYHHYELGAYAGEKLMELRSQESSAYVLLSRIYVALGRPDDAERIMRLMRVRRIGKEPGCSWIELKNHVHVFVVGDQKHPEVGNVRSWLRILTRQMIDEGYKPAYDLILTT